MKPFLKYTRILISLFYVLANEVRVKVYGTSFNVKAFPDENRIETTLIEGKLSVTPIKSHGEPGREIFLKPNEKCIYVRGTKEMRLESGEKSSAVNESGETNTNPKFIIRKEHQHSGRRAVERW